MYQPDMMLRTPDGAIQAVVEVKAREPLTPEIAVSLHANMVSHGLLSQAAYFLLVSQNTGYLWTQDGVRRPEAPAAFQIPISSVVARYLPGLPPGARLFGSQLELLIQQWLTDLTMEREPAQQEPEKTLYESGFTSAIQQAVFLTDVTR